MRSHAVVALAILLACGACTTPPEARLTGGPSPAASTRSAGSQVASQDVLTMAEPRRSQFRLAAEASLGNVDRAQPLFPMLTTVNVLAAEADVVNAPTEADAKARRNRYVGWLIQASEERCSAFLEVLNETDREGNFLFGSLATILGGLGAIFTPSATVRSLAGAAGISSGLRNEFNSAFFYERTIQVLAKSIRDSRAEMRADIEGKFDRSTSQWPFSTALNNVQRYHDQCSLPMAFARITDVLARPGESFADGALRSARERLSLELATSCAPPAANQAAQNRCKTVKDALEALPRPSSP